MIAAWSWAAMAAVWTSTASVNDLATDGAVVVAATAGGGEVYDADGQRIAASLGREETAAGFLGGRPAVGGPAGARFVGGEAVGPRRPVAAIDGGAIWFRDGTAWRDGVLAPVFAEAVVDAAVVDGRPVGFTGDGRVLGLGVTYVLPGPPADVAVVGGELRVAAVGGGAVWRGGRWVVVDRPVTGAGPWWGDAEGAVFDADRRWGAVGAAVTSSVALGDAAFVGTEDGLYRIGAGLRRVTTEDLPCGPFVTGVTEHGGEVVVGTFDGGACALGAEGWRSLQTPSPMVNDVLSDGASLYIATSEGLSVDGEVVGRVADDAPGSAPGLNHESATALAVGPDGAVWATDVLGPVQVGPAWRRHRFGVTGHSYQAVAACEGGAVWAGSEDDGLAVRGVAIGRRVGRGPWSHVNRFDGLPEDWVMDVACAEAGAAYVGTYRRGVGKVSARGWEPVLPDVWVQDLAVDGDRLWVGTPDGLWVVDANGPREVLAEVDVFAVMAVGDAVWVGTRAGLWSIAAP
jgi:ligand-binding sensor domain-containing protein